MLIAQFMFNSDMHLRPNEMQQQYNIKSVYCSNILDQISWAKLRDSLLQIDTDQIIKNQLKYPRMVVHGNFPYK